MFEVKNGDSLPVGKELSRIRNRFAQALPWLFEPESHAAESTPPVERHESAPRILCHEGRPDAPVALLVLMNPGPTNMLLPVIPKLIERGYTIYLYTKGRALETVPGSVPQSFIETKKTAADITPHVVIRTASDLRNGGQHALNAQDEQAWSGAKFIDIDDVPGSSGSIVAEGRRGADVVVAIDEGAADIVAAQRGIDRSQVRVTGRPDFDRYKTHDREAERARARKELGLTNEFVIYFSAQLPPAALTALRQFAETLKQVDLQGKVVKLFYVFHPRAIGDPKYAAYVADAKAILKSLEPEVKVEIIDDPKDPRKGPNNDTIGYAADLMVNTHATEAYNSIHRGVPVLSLGVPNDTEHAADYQESHPAGSDWPLTATGATFHIGANALHEDAKKELERAMHDPKARGQKNARAREVVKADSSATENLEGVIDEVAQAEMEGRK